jgi:hypothetical protein
MIHPPGSLEAEPSKVMATLTVADRFGPAFAIGGVFGTVVLVVELVEVDVVVGLLVEVLEVLDVEVEVEDDDEVEVEVDVVVVRPPLAAHAGTAMTIASTAHQWRSDPGLRVILLWHPLESVRRWRRGPQQQGLCRGGRCRTKESPIHPPFSPPPPIQAVLARSVIGRLPILGATVN